MKHKKCLKRKLRNNRPQIRLEVKGHKGMGIIGILTLILIVLKIVRVIDWGWIIIFFSLMTSLLIKLFIWIISAAVLLHEWRARK